MPQFFRNTVVELMDALAFSSHNQIETFLIRFEMEESDNGGSLDTRKIGIIRYLIDNPHKTGPFGGTLLIEIIEFLIETRSCGQEPINVFPRLVHSLKRNGYIIENGKLQIMLPENLQIAETEDELNTLLDKFGFCTAKGHFKLAVSAHPRRVGFSKCTAEIICRIFI